MRQSAVRSVYVWSAMAAGLTESLLAEESALPEITAQHVLEAIGDMGIARDTVIKLAYRLNLPQLFISQLEQEELTNDNLAVKVIMRWQQIDDSSTSGKGHAKLGEALRRCGQNRIARRMKLRDRAMSSPGGDVNNYVLDRTDSFTREQLEQFGIDLGLTAEQIQQTLNGTGTRSSGLLAVRMVSKCWQQDEHAHEHTVRSKVNRALRNAGTSIVQSDGYINDEEPTHTAITERAEQATKTTNRKVPKISLVILSTLLLVLLVSFIIAVAAAGVMETTPHFDNDIHIRIKPGDTVLVRVPHIYWVYSMDLHLDSGTGAAQAVHCSDIVTDTIETKGLNIDGHYLVNGSILTYNISSGTAGGYTYRVLLITSLDVANQAMDNEFNCDNIVTFCLVIRSPPEPVSLTISYSSYYYLRCVHNDYNCSQLNPLHQSVVQYNYTATEPHAVSIVNLTKDDTTLFPMGEASCVLAKVDNTPQAAAATDLHIINLTRQWTFLLYARVWVGISGVTLVIIVTVGGVIIANYFSKHYSCHHM